MSEDRHITLLRAVLHLMREAEHGPFVKNIFELTVQYDAAECDGMCLKEDIEAWFEENGIEMGMTQREALAAQHMGRVGARRPAKDKP